MKILSLFISFSVLVKLSLGGIDETLSDGTIDFKKMFEKQDK